MSRRTKSVGTCPLGLRGKIVIFAVLLAALPLLVSSFWMIGATRDELKSAVNDRLLSATDEVTLKVRFLVEPALRTLSLLRNVMDSPDLGVDDRVALLHVGIEGMPGLAAMRLDAPGRPSVYLFKHDFKARLDTAGTAAEDALAVPAREPTATGINRVSQPVHLAALDAWLLPLSIDILGLREQDNARLSVFLDLSQLRAFLRDHPLQRAGGVWVLDDQGELLFPADQGPLDPGLPALAGASIAAGNRSILVAPFQQTDGTTALGAVARMDLPNWTLLVAVPEAKAYVAVLRMQGHLVLWLALGLAAAVLGALALAHRIGRPIRDMAAVAAQVGQGHFEVRVREDARGDEIGALEKRLNDMIAGLAEGHRRLDHLARHDTLTGLPNRLSVLDHLRRSVDDSVNVGCYTALLFLDLDRFKKVNDSLGHAVGDQLLKMAAERLRECLRDVDMAARLGGDEFLVVLRRVPDRETVSVVADQVIEAFGAPFHLMDYELYVGVTIGISLAPDDGAEVGELIDYADMAMYKAKEKGRGHYRFFDDELKAKAVRHLTLDSQLRQALERDELVVFYQPIVDADSGRVSGMEALVRWPDKEGGFVADPREIIPLAEETGLVVPLGEWVMDTACRQTRGWHQAGLPKVTVAINVSAHQFARRNYAKRVRQSMEHSGLQPEYIKLELTERLLVEETSHAISLISGLKEMGFQFSVDDFGTGYSSLAYLSRFPLDYLKVAQEFVRGMSENPTDAVIAGAVIALAKSLNLGVIAEGVETGDELKFLRRRNCDLIQGYYFSRPLPAARFEELLRGGGRFDVPPIAGEAD